MKRIQTFILILLSVALIGGTANAITLDPVADRGQWQIFYFDGPGSSADRTFDFTLSESTSLFVTDHFNSGDRFEIFNGVDSLGLTSLITSTSDEIDDPQAAYDSGLFSTGEFILTAGTYNISIVAVDSPWNSGGASLKLGSAVPVPSAIILFGIGVLGLAGIRRRKQ